MLPTPSTSHVSFDNVYEPSEDSFLLLDTLSSASEVEFLKTRFPKNEAVPVIAEVGVGSGVVLAFANAHATEIFGKPHVLTLAIDINRHACEATRQTVEKASTDLAGSQVSVGTFLGSIQADLGSAMRSGVVDVLIFNPPYVPSEESLADLRDVALSEPQFKASSSAKFERDSKLLALSYAGGADGMETTNILLSDLPRILNERRGVAYILLCAQNKPAAVMEYIKSWHANWNVEVVGHSGKTAGWEVLQVLRVWPDNLPHSK
ncbi:hypothetical protein BT63DRAFT_121928 [Microthyrium microscopicum]|uniref:ERF1 methyltransferase catalytic subunit MTQ2 n=1 Tax=Microthyrium microscopicum TaxID=703497 RepID=A0A6A6TU08_9PEZI|nr:hypothetical protein BT63DRAFT_121928 [Microthyrium microscopicum]